MSESLNLAYQSFRGLLWNPLPDQGSANIPLFVDRTPAVLNINTAAAESRTIQQPDRSGLFLLVNARNVTGTNTCTLTMSGTYDGVNSTLLFNAAGQYALFTSVLTAAGSGTTLDTYQWRLLESGNATLAGKTFDVSWQQAEGAAPSAASFPLLVANRRLKLVAASAIFDTASSSGTVMLTQDSATQSAGGGNNMLSGTISTASGAKTVVNGSLSATLANLYLSPGQRLSLTLAGTQTGLANCVVTATLMDA